jgi:hypothetical protein
VIGYVYVQIFVGTLVSLDEYRSRRLITGGHVEPRSANHIAQRRVLQLKLLMTIMIMETVISGWPAYDPSPRPIGSSAAAVLLALSLCGIAIFVRRPWSAWAAAAVLSLATAGYAAIAITGHQLSDLVGVVWLGLVGTYLWGSPRDVDTGLCRDLVQGNGFQGLFVVGGAAVAQC